ncbi:hypothetical protein DNTS_022068 [Danionella cerebrum]|uniref:FAM192A/Fyv6 N-terminal domain-containing protein n=1 Tax=Danionella cerebrum TaxID=2873325 RepID=A0A553PYU7_9TELE|nr:hypothetical protein DNTS_022068 [Danionella translucida]
MTSSNEAPEEEYDPRSLFERLQEQKDKKQEEFEEQFKFRGLALEDRGSIHYQTRLSVDAHGLVSLGLLVGV